jgi:hypothetical protein
MAAVIRSRSYLIVAIALLVLMAAGFARTFYLRPWFDVPPITALLHVHGAVFTAWFALFVIQARLISAQNYRTHQQLGIAGMVLAVLVVVTSLATSVVSASAVRPRPMGMTPPQFVIFPIFIALAFGGLVAAAFVNRRRPQIHKRLMMLAMIALIGPPTARLITLGGYQAHFLAIQMSVSAAFVIACVVADWVRNRTLHPIYLVGGLLLVLSWPARAWVARTPEWEAVGKWLASLN